MFNPNGRISRKGFVLGFLLPWLALTVLLPLVLPRGGLFALLNTAISLFYLWPSFVAVPVRRLHDLGLSGWWQVLVPLLGIVGIGIAFTGAMGAYDGTAQEFTQEMQGMTRIEQRAYLANMVKASPLGWLGLIMLLTWIFEYLAFAVLRGKPAENRFGNDPLLGGRGFAD
nr:DUF805 domain-containing protein [Parvularcula dongshanensis]